MTNGFDECRCDRLPDRYTLFEEVFYGLVKLQRKEIALEIIPQPFDRIEFWTIGRERKESNVLWTNNSLGPMPTRLVQDQNDVDVRRYMLAQRL